MAFFCRTRNLKQGVSSDICKLSCRERETLDKNVRWEMDTLLFRMRDSKQGWKREAAKEGFSPHPFEDWKEGGRNPGTRHAGGVRSIHLQQFDVLRTPNAQGVKVLLRAAQVRAAGGQVEVDLNPTE